MSELLLDRAGRRRSPTTLPGFHAGHAPGNKGLHYLADPPKVEEIVAVMRTAGTEGTARALLIAQSASELVRAGTIGCRRKRQSRG
jgi:hypothetical protein